MAARWIGVGLLTVTLLSAAVAAPQSTTFEIPAYEGTSLTLRCKAGHLTRVVVSGVATDPEAPLGLYVFDPQGNCVASDDATTSSVPNQVAVQWYPAATGAHSIEVFNLGLTPTDVILAMH